MRNSWTNMFRTGPAAPSPAALLAQPDVVQSLQIPRADGKEEALRIAVGAFLTRAGRVDVLPATLRETPIAPLVSALEGCLTDALCEGCCLWDYVLHSERTMHENYHLVNPDAVEQVTATHRYEAELARDMAVLTVREIAVWRSRLWILLGLQHHALFDAWLSLAQSPDIQSAYYHSHSRVRSKEGATFLRSMLTVLHCVRFVFFLPDDLRRLCAEGGRQRSATSVSTQPVSIVDRRPRSRSTGTPPQPSPIADSTVVSRPIRDTEGSGEVGVDTLSPPPVTVVTPPTFVNAKPVSVAPAEIPISLVEREIALRNAEAEVKKAQAIVVKKDSDLTDKLRHVQWVFDELHTMYILLGGQENNSLVTPDGVQHGTHFLDSNVPVERQKILRALPKLISVLAPLSQGPPPSRRSRKGSRRRPGSRTVTPEITPVLQEGVVVPLEEEKNQRGKEGVKKEVALTSPGASHKEYEETAHSNSSKGRKHHVKEEDEEIVYINTIQDTPISPFDSSRTSATSFTETSSSISNLSMVNNTLTPMDVIDVMESQQLRPTNSAVAAIVVLLGFMIINEATTIVIVDSLIKDSTPPPSVSRDVGDVIRLAKSLRLGVSLADRRYGLTTYHTCFLGNEAVDWLLENGGTPHGSSEVPEGYPGDPGGLHHGNSGFNKIKNREDAVALGRRMEDMSLLRHVTDGHPFEDSPYYYRFSVDEAGHDQISSTGSFIRHWLGIEDDAMTSRSRDSSISGRSYDEDDSPIPDEEPVIEGVLEKRGKGVLFMGTGTKRRYFVLLGKKLYYYKTKSDYYGGHDKWTGSIDLRGADIISVEDTRGQFTVSGPHCRRDFELSAESPAMRSKWIHYLREASVERSPSPFAVVG